MNENAREPIGNAYRDEELELSGQVYWQDQTFEAGREGDTESTLGYILFQRYYLSLQSVVIEKGDMITKMGGGDQGGGDLDVELPLFFYRFRYRGHHADQKGATLLKAWFTDKDPVKKR